MNLPVLPAWALLSLGACSGSLGVYGPGKPSTPGVDGTPTGTAPTSTETTATIDTSTPPTSTSSPSTSTSTSTTPTVDTGTAPTPWVNGDPAVPPPYTAPPPNALAYDCATLGIAADLDVSSVDVKSHDDNLEVRTLTSPVTGWYDLYNRAMAREGDGEWNESAMVRIANGTSWFGLPVVANCEDDWVTVDADNYFDPDDTLFYLGTFWFETGDNVVELEHVCPRIRAGSCTDLEFLDDDDTTCEADDGNSAHLWRDSLCLVAPVP